jgi:uncharacterized membrane protein YgaE (UPF0421/DUF939 family)
VGILESVRDGARRVTRYKRCVTNPDPDPGPAPVGRTAALLDDAAHRSRTTLRDRGRRLHARSPAIAQASLAAAGAWLVASDAIGHARPFFAPISAIVVLGVTHGRHARRAFELAAGVTLGICVADLIVQGLGQGPLTIALVVALAMTVAIALGGETLLVSQAATSATLVATLGGSDHFTLARAVDAFAGGSVALVVGFLLLPIDPVRVTRTAASAVLDELASLLFDLATALERRDRDAVLDALERGRALDGRHATFAESAGMGLEIARYAPVRRRDRPMLQRYATAAAMLDLAIRDVRVLARGALRAVDLADDVPPEVVVAVRDLAASVRALAPALDDPRRAQRAHEHAVRAAAGATLSLERTANLSTSAIVGQVRSTALDLLRGLGEDRDSAAATIRGAAAEASAGPPV